MAKKNNTQAVENTQEVENTQATENVEATPTLPEVVLTKDYGIGKANADLKARVFDICFKALAAEGLVPMWVRTGNSSGEVNELGCVMQIVVKDGYSHEHCITLNPTVKAIEDKKVGRNTVYAFDILSANERYNDWAAEKETKAREAKEKKEKKIAEDKAKREAKEAEQTA